VTGRVMGASAPGKILLVGEYAVLEGAPALVAAVGARAEAHPAAPGARPSQPEARAALRRAEDAFGPLGGGLTVDVSELRRGARKLGLGSSAAAAAAAVGAVAVARGIPLDPERLFPLTYAAHREIQPHGSGVDVAAAVHGGCLRFRMRGEGLPDVEPASPPEGLVIRVVHTGAEASTHGFLTRLEAFARESPDRYRIAFDLLADAATAAVRAFADDASAFVEAAGRYGEIMAGLGALASLPIVSPPLRRIEALARRHGGRSKPSGAGGGDVAVAFFDSRGAVDEFERDCRRAGFSPLPLGLFAPGVQPIAGPASSRPSYRERRSRASESRGSSSRARS